MTQTRKLTHISGKRWFQRTYGNTYHSATLHFSDGSTEYTGKHYGYGDQYQQTAIELAVKLGALPARELYANGMTKGSNWQLLQENGVSYSVADVSREKDL